ncbi:hypothetical protein IFT67_15805 [Sphingomonas sp. CFBP 13728]|nr:hypothetical protein [Sphingomonas sp. CFBP 13728]MBD8620394.1 hypothetical protein [Sphingomonas sp. CFBP 13728]
MPLTGLRCGTLVNCTTDAATTAPASAVAIKPPVRAIALLNPDAVPVW